MSDPDTGDARAAGLIPELWSADDRRTEAALVVAVSSGDLLTALLAIEGADLDTAARVRAWVAERAARVRELAQGASALDALIVALVQEAGLVGDAADYYAPDNSRLSRVLTRRTGQPILIASAWLLVGGAAGLPIEGVGLPGHFIVRLRGEGPPDAERGDLLVDVFQGGVPLTVAQCTAIAQRAMPGRAFDLAWLATAPVSAIAPRVLRNLAHACQQQDDEAGGYRAVRLLAALAQEDGPVQLELARLTELHGAWPEAVGMYRGIVKRFAGRREAQIAELKLVELERQSRTLN